MNTEQEILAAVRKSGGVSGAGLARTLGITRQAVNHHLQNLTRRGLICKAGVTRGAKYRICSKGRGVGTSANTFARSYRVAGLAEDKVFEEVSSFLVLKRRLSSAAIETYHYAFTEMLNNAIDHSGAKTVRVEAMLDAYDCSFLMRDHGVGVFRSIVRKFGLADERQAVAELLKGKTTTMSEKHSGEGIFFTSKAGEWFSLRSHATELVVDNTLPDAFVGRIGQLAGTEVRFRIKRRARRRLSALFSEYAPEEFGFEFARTRIMVRLYRDAYVSRSEAKRLLAGLDRFREVVLDFDRVRSVGQGFADEVFRVFRASHPGIVIRVANLDPALRPIMGPYLDEYSPRNLTIS